MGGVGGGIREDFPYPDSTELVVDLVFLTSNIYFQFSGTIYWKETFRIFTLWGRKPRNLPYIL